MQCASVSSHSQPFVSLANYGTMAAAPPPNNSTSFVTTAFTLPGYRVVRSYGVVRGITVRSLSICGFIAAGFGACCGGRSTLYTKLCESARQEAYGLALTHALAAGGNAIIGFHYDANEIIGGVTEIIAYGTAVWVEPDTTA